MVNVEQIEIDLTIPTNEVSIVSMQPHLNLTKDEPFKLIDETTKSQLDGINRTLELAQDSFDGRSAHFTIFPEYSVPGINGVELIENEISSQDWSNNSVIIAGIHGLNKDEYHNLCNKYKVTVSEENAVENVGEDRWVNCGFIWFKENNGDIKRFIQLKIRPAWPENNVTCYDMFNGSTIYVFESKFDNGVSCRFSSFVCFDWVAEEDGISVRDEMLQKLEEQNENEIALHWIFVIQHNTSPNHTTFLKSTADFLTDPNNCPLIQRSDAIILHCNTSPSKEPLKPSNSPNGAFSACTTGPNRRLDLKNCRPTVCMQPSQYRRSNILKDAQCEDVIFREMGECINRFKTRVPRFLGAGAANRTHLVKYAEVHAVNDNQDPRLSGKAIQASVKWLNDSLEDIDSLANVSLVNCNLFEEAEGAHEKLVPEISLTEPKKIKNQINWSACYKAGSVEKRSKDRCKNPDFWYNREEPIEKEALEHSVHTLSNLNMAYDIDIKNATFHGILNLDDKYIEVLAIQGENYSDCRFHYDNNVPKNTTDPILVILSDRKDHKPTPEEYKKFYEADLSTGEKIIDYQTLVNLSREAENVEQLKDNVNEYLPGERKII